MNLSCTDFCLPENIFYKLGYALERGMFFGHQALVTMFNCGSRSRLFSVLLCLSLFGMSVSSSYADVRRNTVNYIKNKQELVITGSGFGSRCAQCDVIAHYTDLNYSLPILSWGSKKIRVRVPQLGSDVSSFTIKTKNDSVTTVKPIPFEPDIIPPKKIGKLVRPSEFPKLIIREFKSNSNLGDKGLHSYDVSQPVPACGVMGSRFSHAEIVVGKRTRFARTAIVKTPSKPCFSCKPVIVKFFVEPTGHLHYQLHVYRERIEGICTKRVRG